MANLKFEIDAEAIAKEFAEFALEVEQDLNTAVANLAAITNAKVKEMAQKELHSTRQRYIDALSFAEVSPGLWVVSLDESALWIENGLPSDFDMKPGLLKNAKMSKDGVQYRVVPFNHSLPPSQMGQSNQEAAAFIKANLKKQGITFKKIELNADGSPKTGKLHSNLNLGGSNPANGVQKNSNGVNIYQNKTASGSIRRDVMTFRTVTSNQQDKWIHPGIDPKLFLDRAFEEAMSLWETEILPAVLEKNRT